MRYDPYVCNDSVVSAYLVAVGFGDVGSVNGETEALGDDDDWIFRVKARPTVLAGLFDELLNRFVTRKPVRNDMFAGYSSAGSDELEQR